MTNREHELREELKRTLYDAHRWAVRGSGLDLGPYDEALASGIVADSWSAMAEAAYRVFSARIVLLEAELEGMREKTLEEAALTAQAEMVKAWNAGIGSVGGGDVTLAMCMDTAGRMWNAVNVIRSLSQHETPVEGEPPATQQGGER